MTSIPLVLRAVGDQGPMILTANSVRRATGEEQHVYVHNTHFVSSLPSAPSWRIPRDGWQNQTVRADELYLLLPTGEWEQL